MRVHEYLKYSNKILSGEIAASSYSSSLKRGIQNKFDEVSVGDFVPLTSAYSSFPLPITDYAFFFTTPCCCFFSGSFPFDLLFFSALPAAASGLFPSASVLVIASASVSSAFFFCLSIYCFYLPVLASVLNFSLTLFLFLFSCLFFFFALYFQLFW